MGLCYPIELRESLVLNNDWELTKKNSLYNKSYITTRSVYTYDRL